jgi:hypothetical protein
MPGCGSPSVDYLVASDDDARNPTEGQIIFQLRTTNVTLSAPAAPDGKTPLTSAVDVCDKKTTPAQCLDGVTAKPTPDSTGNRYLAKPGDRVWFTHTKLAATTVDGNDTLIKSVAVSYNDNTSQVIAAVGTGAVAGFGVAGPYGAVGGALISGIGAGVTEYEAKATLRSNSREFDQLFKGKSTVTPQQEPFTDLICKVDNVDPSAVARPKLSLVLPVNIDLSAAAKSDTDNPQCWHLLGVHPPTSNTRNKSNPLTGNGWLYRIVLGKQPFGSDDPQKYFASANPKHDFPYTACRTTELDLVWWQTAQLGMPNLGTEAKPIFEYKSYQLTVADPNLVQVAPLPKAGSINLGSVCGADVT